MVKVQVRGLDGFQHELLVSETRLVDGIRSLMSELAEETAEDARARARSGKLTGASMASIRAHGTTVRAGDDVPWYGFADFGGRVGRKRSVVRRYIKGGRWLYPAVRNLGVEEKSNKTVDEATKGLR